MTERILSICDKVIEYSFYLLFFLVPLILTPLNYELFEYNKMMLVYFLTAIIFAAWLIKMVTNKKPIFRRTFLDLPLLIFFLSQFLSFWFSIDRHTSFWGYYSRFHGGLASTIAYLLLYWAFVSNMNKRKTLRSIFYTLCSAALVAAYGMAEHFGIDKDYWVQDVQNRVFSTLGQPNWLAAYLVALIPLTWALALKEKRKLFLIPYSLFIILYLCLLYTKSRSGLLGFGVAYAVFWGLIFTPNLVKRKKPYTLKPFFLLTFSILLLTFLVGSPWTPSLGQIWQKRASPEATKEVAKEKPPIPIGGTESGEIRRIVWKGATDIWRHYPIFGSGVETFAYSYYNFRPREHNDVSEWDFLYNKAHNEYLNFAANTGTFGLLAYLGVIGTFLFWALRHYAKKNLIIALLAGYVSILITNFFGFSVVAVALFFFLFPAMSMVLAQGKEAESKRVKEIAILSRSQYLAIAIILLVTAYCLLTILCFWYADTLYAKGEKFNDAGQYDQAFNNLEDAVMLNPGEPFYQSELAQASASLAVAVLKQKEATLSAELVDLAISSSDKALEITPRHLNFWKNRTRVFYTLAEIDESYNQQALATLLQATELAPTDAKIFYNLGVLYAKLGQDETAIKTLEKTVELKPNYETARYALALFYEQKGEIEKAKNQLNYILEKVNPKNKTVKKKLEELE